MPTALRLVWSLSHQLSTPGPVCTIKSCILLFIFSNSIFSCNRWLAFNDAIVMLFRTYPWQYSVWRYFKRSSMCEAVSATADKCCILYIGVFPPKKFEIANRTHRAEDNILPLHASRFQAVPPHHSTATFIPTDRQRQTPHRKRRQVNTASEPTSA